MAKMEENEFHVLIKCYFLVEKKTLLKLSLKILWVLRTINFKDLKSDLLTFVVVTQARVAFNVLDAQFM